MQPSAEHSSIPSTLDRLEGLFVEHVDAVYNVAYRVLWSRADAEDVVQRTFLKGITGLDRLHDPGRARPWLLQVGYREAIATVRRRREVPTAPQDLPEPFSLDRCPADVAVATETGRVLGELLASMDEQERVAVVLRDVEQLNMVEVARVLNIGVSAAKMRVHRGRARLRHLVSARGLL